jgi:hypothetical protein
MVQIYELTLSLHSLVRWVVIIAGVIALVRYGYGWLKAGTPFTVRDQQLAVVYAVVVTVQFVLGVINLILLLLIGGFTPGRDIEHTVYGLIITALASIGARRWKDAPAQTRFRNLFLIVLITILLALLSVWRLRGSFLFGLM